MYLFAHYARVCLSRSKGNLVATRTLDNAIPRPEHTTRTNNDVSTRSHALLTQLDVTKPHSSSMTYSFNSLNRCLYFHTPLHLNVSINK